MPPTPTPPQTRACVYDTKHPPPIDNVGCTPSGSRSSSPDVCRHSSPGIVISSTCFSSTTSSCWFCCNCCYRGMRMSKAALLNVIFASTQCGRVWRNPFHRGASSYPGIEIGVSVKRRDPLNTVFGVLPHRKHDLGVQRLGVHVHRRRTLSLVQELGIGRSPGHSPRHVP